MSRNQELEQHDVAGSKTVSQRHHLQIFTEGPGAGSLMGGTLGTPLWKFLEKQDLFDGGLSRVRWRTLAFVLCLPLPMTKNTKILLCC